MTDEWPPLNYSPADDGAESIPGGKSRLLITWMTDLPAIMSATLTLALLDTPEGDERQCNRQN